jgi:peptidoglycan/LPS O-acetylase OafA/YrhL
MQSSSLIRPLAYPAIDGLRFYAALLVFLVHSVGYLGVTYFRIPEAGFVITSADPLTSVMAYVAQGHHGVDWFFLISGFLMIRVVSAQAAKGTFSYVGFLKSRWVRIYPAFLVAYLATVLAFTVMGWGPFVWRDFFLGLVFANILPITMQKYLHVSWTLGYEFLFYTIVPLALLLRGRLHTAWLAAALAGLGFVAWGWLYPHHALRFVALLIGMGIGSFSDERLKAWANRIPIAPVLAAYVAVHILPPHLNWSYTSYLVMLWAVLTLGFVLIVYGDNVFNRFFSLSWMRELGTVSYSFYLWHTVCISLITDLVLPKLGLYPNKIWGPMVLMPLFLAASLLVARVSYAWLERPYFNRPAAN